MTESGDARSFEGLDPATLAVRDLVAGSRELVGRMAQMMGMNPTDMSAVGALTQRGPMGVVELAAHLGIRSASATAMVDRLERSGHVQRQRVSGDRRRVTVVETSTARDAAYRAWAPLIQQIDRAARALTDEERCVVCRFLEQITAINELGGRDAAPPASTAIDIKSQSTGVDA